MESESVPGGLEAGIQWQAGISSACQHFLPLRLHFLALEICACGYLGCRVGSGELDISN